MKMGEKKTIMSGNRIWNEMLASILVNAVYAMANMPIILINNLLQPLSFLIVITLVSHGALLGLAIEGAFVMTAVSAGLGLQGDLSHLKNDLKVQEMVVSSPTSAGTYLAGMAISELIYSVPTIIILIILALLFLHISAIGALIITAALLLIFLVATSLGFFFATITYDIMQSWAFGGILSILFSALTPVYYPIYYIPMPWQYLVYISPTTYAAEIMQSVSGFINISTLNFALDWIILIGMAIALLSISIYKSRWVE